MVKPIVVMRNDLNNVGDIASNPLQYFMNHGTYDIIDIEKISTTNYEADRPIIVGGGGLIANEWIGDDISLVLSPNDYNQLTTFANKAWRLSDPTNAELRKEFNKKLQTLVKEYIDKLQSSVKPPRFMWGAGHNEAATKKAKFIDYPEYLSAFDKVGIRDHGQLYDWAPCASCMHPAFRKKYPIKHDIIWFEHKKQIIKSTDFGSDPIMRFTNSGNNIENTIEILGSANTIITNSYHGAYWGVLLGKKVVVQEPWSTKFFFMKHPPTFIQKGETWRDVIDTARSYKTAHEESVAATNTYWNEIKGSIL